METRWRVTLFGELRVEGEGRVITRFRTQKTGALLAYLAFHRQRSHPRDWLLEVLWPDDDLDAARHKLRNALSSLRSQLEPPGVPAGAVLATDRVSARLNALSCTTDVAGFEAALAAAADSRSTLERTQRLGEAVGLYRGELLPGFYEEWIEAERERLEVAYHEALLRLARALEECGNLPGALEMAHRAVAADPLHEGARRELIRLLAASGQSAAAREQYRDLQRLLQEHLGEVPAAPPGRVIAQLPPLNLPELASPAVRSRRPSAWPRGTVTLLLAERGGPGDRSRGPGKVAEGSAAPWQAMQQEIRRHGGRVDRVTVDALVAVFARARDALTCAVTGQQALCHESVRIAIHTAFFPPTHGTHTQPEREHATHLLLAAHPGQVLCSEATAGLVRRDPAPGTWVEDLGLHRLRREAQATRIFQVCHREMPCRAFPPLQTEGGPVVGLPLQLTRFFGREEEVAHLSALLLAEETRLVTLTGVGGCGKTRLALAVLERLATTLRTRVWCVALAALTDARLIADALRETLRLPAPATGDLPLDQVVSFLRGQPGLLLLDNLEHLLPAGATFVQTLLERVPELTCLVTSRRLLQIAGEREMVVEPLPIPERGAQEGGALTPGPSPKGWERSDLDRGQWRLPHDGAGQVPLSQSLGEGPGVRALSPEHLLQCPSVQLFVDRAQAVRPDFPVTAANAPSLAELCRRLEGIPLAIELAAAQMRLFTPAQLLARVEERFELLVSRQRGGPARHRTLRAALDWTHELLAPEVQAFFARLSVFRGGFTLESAAAVAAEREPSLLEWLHELCASSLVTAADVDGAPRFHLLETVREYASEQLEERGEGAATRGRHLRFLLALAEPTRAQTGTRAGERLMRRLEREHRNFEAALEAAFAEDWQTGLRLTTALGWFWMLGGHWQEGRIWRERYLARAVGLPPPDRLDVLVRVADAAEKQLDRASAARLMAEALSLGRQLGDTTRIAYVLGRLTFVATSAGEYSRARAYGMESLSLAAECGNPAQMGQTAFHLSQALLFGGDPMGARRLLEIQHTLAVANRDAEGLMIASRGMGEVAFYLEEYADAQARFEMSLAARRESGNSLLVAHALLRLTSVALAQSDIGAARRLCAASLGLNRAAGVPISIADALYESSRVALFQGDCTAASLALEEGLRIHGVIGGEDWIAFFHVARGHIALRQGQPEAARERYDTALAIHESAGDTGAVACLLDCVGHVQRALGRRSEARACYERSLALRVTAQDLRGITESRFSLAEAALEAGDTGRARALFQICLTTYHELHLLTPGSLLRRRRAVPDRAATRGERWLYDKELLPRREFGGRRGMGDAWAGLGRVALAAGDMAQAQRWHARNLALRRELGEPHEAARAMAVLGEVARAAGDEALAALWVEAERELCPGRDASQS